MVWGKSEPRGVEDLEKRLRQNDPALVSLTLLRGRKFGPCEVVQICEALGTNCVLREFNASGHKMNPESATIFAEMLSKNGTIERIGLGDSEFGDEGIAALAPGIAASTSLRSLDLEYKGIGATGMQKLSEALNANSTLQELRLNRNLLGDTGLLALATPGLRGIEVLELREVGIGDKDGECLEKLLVCGRSLRMIDLGRNSLASGGVKSLAKGLRRSQHMEDFRLDHVDVGTSADVGDLAEALAGSSSLGRIVLQACGISDSQGMKFASLIHSRTSLPLELDLSCNDLDSETVQAFVHALSDMHQERKIRLSIGGNRFGGDCAAKLASVTFSGLEGLNIFNTAFDKASIEKFCSSLSSGGLPGLTTLDVGACRIQMEEMELLFQSLSSGTLPSLTTLVVAVNPGTEHERFDDALKLLRSSRDTLDVIWSASDQASQAQLMSR